MQPTAKSVGQMSKMIKPRRGDRNIPTLVRAWYRAIRSKC